MFVKSGQCNHIVFRETFDAISTIAPLLKIQKYFFVPPNLYIIKDIGVFNRKEFYDGYSKNPMGDDRHTLMELRLTI